MILDALFGGLRWWRQRRGGTWYHVRELMHPQIEHWTRSRPDRVWGEVLTIERFQPQ